MNDVTREILSSGKHDKNEIIAAIIAVTQERIKLTDLRNQTNLCFFTLRKYLKVMTRSSLIERKKIIEDSGRTVIVYQATQKGLSFLEVYCELLSLIYGNNFVENKNNLAVACLECCRETESELVSW
jgi:predicted transcriptional regulator